MKNPFQYFNSSPEIIRLTVMMYVRYPLSLRQVEDRCCQSNANQSPKHLKLRRSGCQPTPFGERGGAIFFEGFAAVEVTVEIEMIVDRGMDGS